MADSSVSVTEGSGKNIDTRTNAAGDHRQVIVLGNPTATDSVAEVQATDPSSNTLGLVVRDVNTSAIVAQLASGVAVTGTLTGITNSIAVHVLSTAGTMAVDIGKTAGTITIRTDPGYELGSIRGISNTIGAHITGTSGTLTFYLDPGTTLEGIQSTVGVRITETAGTLQVKLDRESVISGIQSTISVVPVTGSNVKLYDDGFDAMRVSIVGNSVSSSLLISGQQAAGTNIPLQVNSSGAIKVYDIAGGSITINAMPTTSGVYLAGTAGTLHVRLADNSAGLATDDLALTPATDVGFPIMGFFDDTATDSVDEGDAGFLRMTGNRIQMVHSDSTASMFVASGTASGVSVSGNTIISPSANASFKIHAFSVQTTGLVSLVATFTNGGGSATEFWRALVTPASTTSETRGANLSSAGPGSPLFVTGTSTTLALRLDTATLVHYTVAYTKESA